MYPTSVTLRNSTVRSQLHRATLPKGCYPFSSQPTLRKVRVSSNAGRTEPFNENAAQVKRLISRDRKEFLGNSEDILDKYTTEFGNTAASATSTSTTTATQATPIKSTATLSSDNPFGKAPASSPFGSAPAPKTYKNSIEPAGLRPDMGPDVMPTDKPFNLFESITITQVVLFFSFSLIIALMISTFYFVLNVGGVRLNGI